MEKLEVATLAALPVTLMPQEPLAPDPVVDGTLRAVLALAAVVDPVPPLATGNVPETLVTEIPVQLDKLPDAGVPKAGVTKVGLLDKTMFPVPVTALESVTPP